ncbi:AraC-type DNA-binding protein [Arenibacter palladensis]|uniref:AraC-type DNA-binding protein n=1 Tax=Arenibacter palladensis TaxID=237373 RepID=A0A1M4XUQ3_9FLAO|nr:helix-turn-helix domain-containing protein [Arenibacter palladensis]SHE97229.1 AraC-type DNA-binding protein [Arenibacter palladensis]
MDIFNTYTLINEHTGDMAFRIWNFEDNGQFCKVKRLNHYSLIWVKKGSGTAKIDFADYEFSQNVMFALTPYQPFMFNEKEKLEGVVLNFHPDFFCIHKHNDQVACNGVLFNNIYNPPMLNVEDNAKEEFEMLISLMRNGIQKSDIAQYDLLVSYLKIFLINASRTKAQQQPEELEAMPDNKEPFILQKLKNMIEANFKSKHSASDYAELLNITPKALAKITKNHFNKTMTNLISERIIIEAKRELYLTDKSVKEIAFELGYDDEHYFSRFFKNNADISPSVYRETVGFARAVS